MNAQLLGWKIPPARSNNPLPHLWQILTEEARGLHLIGTYSETDGMSRYEMLGVPLQRPLLSIISPVPRMGVSHEDPPSFLFTVAILYVSSINSEATRQIYFDFLTRGRTHQCEAGDVRDRSSGKPTHRFDWADGLSACVRMLAQSILTTHAHISARIAVAQRRDAEIGLAHRQIMTIEEALATAS